MSMDFYVQDEPDKDGFGCIVFPGHGTIDPDAARDLAARLAAAAAYAERVVSRERAT